MLMLVIKRNIKSGFHCTLFYYKFDILNVITITRTEGYQALWFSNNEQGSMKT